MSRYKRIAAALGVALQLPLAYFLSGHDLLTRASGTGAIYLVTLCVFGFTYWFLDGYLLKK
jgi:hypothetical protein